MKTLYPKPYYYFIIIIFYVAHFESQVFAQTRCEEPIRVRENITLCQGDVFQFGERMIISSGVYIQTFKTTDNCDSIVTLGADYLNNTNFSFTETITTNESFFFNEQYLTEAGIYRDTFTDTRGCDSILTLTLQVVLEQENCDNGIDDDGDGLIDAFDKDCLCLLTGTPTNLVPNGDFEEKVGCCRGISSDEDLCVDNWVNLSNTSIIYHHPECWSVLGQDLPKEGITLESGFIAGPIHSIGLRDEISGITLGICLEEPMYAGNTYIISFDIGRSFEANTIRPVPENMHFAINGISNCTMLNDYRVEERYCDDEMPFEPLANINLFELNPQWNRFELEVTPTSIIEAIFLGKNCKDDLSPFRSAHIFFDNFSITSKNGYRIKNEIEVNGNPCQGEFELIIPNTDNLQIDWYKDSLPLTQIANRPFNINSNIIANVNGIYHAKVTFEDGRCQLVGPLDIESFELALPKDTLICRDQDLLLSFAHTGVSYQWQDGSSQPFYSINEEGLYWVEAQKGNCIQRDSITVKYAQQRSFLPSDTTICDIDSFFIAPSPPVEHVLWWENPLELNGLLVKETGVYHAFIIDQGCDWLDSVKINFVNAPEFNLGNDTTLCSEENLVISIPMNMGNYQWQDGSITPTQLITQTGLYQLSGTIDDCPVRDSILITFEDCPKDHQYCQAYLPNTFSPNGDGINDELQLLTDCELQFFEMKVYDRWGNAVFSTTNIQQGWDGEFAGQIVDTGVYLWIVRYQFLGQALPVEKVATITMMR